MSTRKEMDSPPQKITKVFCFVEAQKQKNSLHFCRYMINLIGYSSLFFRLNHFPALGEKC